MRDRLVRFLRFVFGGEPHPAYVQGFEDGLAHASAVVGFDLRETVPVAPR